MSVDLRLPNINATTNEGKIEQLQSFVYQLVQELNFCLNLLEKKTNDVSSEVFDSKGNSKIEVNTNNILLKVEQGDSISDINLSPEGIKIDASKIDLNGVTTVNNRFSIDTNGYMHLEGDIVKIDLFEYGVMNGMKVGGESTSYSVYGERGIYNVDSSGFDRMIIGVGNSGSISIGTYDSPQVVINSSERPTISFYDSDGNRKTGQIAMLSDIE